MNKQFAVLIKYSSSIFVTGFVLLLNLAWADNAAIPRFSNDTPAIVDIDADWLFVPNQLLNGSEPLVSNYIHLQSGMDSYVRIGPDKDIINQFFARVIFHSASAAIAIIMGLYFFVVYLVRSDGRNLLYFSLFAISLGIRQMVIGEKIIMFLWPSVNQSLVIMLEYISPQVACSFLMAYAYNTAISFPTGKVTASGKRIYLLLVSSPVVFPLLGIVFGGVKGQVLMLPFFSICLVSLAFYYSRAASVLRSSDHRLLSNLFYLNGLSVISFCVWDVLVATSVIQGPLLATYALTGFVFGQAVLTTMVLRLDRSRALEMRDELTALNLQLEEANFTLEYRVEEQTKLFRTDAAYYSKMAASYARLSSSVTKGRELELTYLTQEVHDVLSAPMLVTSHTLAQVSSRIWYYDRALSRILEETGANLTSAYSDFRGVIHKSRPASLDVLYLEQILRQDLNVLMSLRPLISVTQSTKNLTLAAKTNVFRIAQEALANTIKYANATIFSIEIMDQEKDGQQGWGIRIEDDGKGADVANIQLNGLLGVKNRFEELLGGTVNFEAQLNQGFLIRGWIPKEINSLSSDVL